jgi:hypothetical protein
MGTYAFAAGDRTTRQTTVASAVDTITLQAGAGQVQIFSYGDFQIDVKVDSTVDPTVGDVTAYCLPAGVPSVQTVSGSTSRAIVVKLISAGAARYVITAL